MDVASELADPVSSHPTTLGKVRVTGRPSMTASVSIPPVPRWGKKSIEQLKEGGVTPRRNVYPSALLSDG